MGRISALVNFTKKERIFVGKSGEEPVIQILKEMKKKFQWDLDNDCIELCDSENMSRLGYCNNEDSSDEDDESGDSNIVKSKDIFITREGIHWKDVDNLWEDIKNKNK